MVTFVILKDKNLLEPIVFTVDKGTFSSHFEKVPLELPMSMTCIKDLLYDSLELIPDKVYCRVIGNISDIPASVFDIIEKALYLSSLKLAYLL